MKTEFVLSEKRLNFNEAQANAPVGYRLPTKKELMLMYINDEGNSSFPKSNVWSSDEFTKKNGESTSAFAILLLNGYTATISKTRKAVAMYVKK